MWPPCLLTRMQLTTSNWPYWPAAISVKSPIAAGLIGKEKGEVAKVIAPAGAMEFEVLEISRD